MDLEIIIDNPFEFMGREDELTYTVVDASGHRAFMPDYSSITIWSNGPGDYTQLVIIFTQMSDVQYIGTSSTFYIKA